MATVAPLQGLPGRLLPWLGRALLAGALALTASAGARIGDSAATVIFSPEGDGVHTVIEVQTDPAITRRHELTLFMNPRGVSGRSRSVVVPPVEPGRYRLEVALAAGEWNIALRYGVGLDLYYAFVRATIAPHGSLSQRRGVLFEGELGDEVPALVQPLGFALFGLVAAVALALVLAVLRGLRAAEP